MAKEWTAAARAAKSTFVEGMTLKSGGEKEKVVRIGAGASVVITYI